MVDKNCFGGEGVVSEEGGPHFTMMGCQVVFCMIVIGLLVQSYRTLGIGLYLHDI